MNWQNLERLAEVVFADSASRPGKFQHPDNPGKLSDLHVDIVQHLEGDAGIEVDEPRAGEVVNQSQFSADGIVMISCDMKCCY